VGDVKIDDANTIYVIFFNNFFLVFELSIIQVIHKNKYNSII